MRRIDLDEAVIRRLVAAGATMNDLAFEFCCSVGTIRGFLRQHGIEPVMARICAKPDPTPEEIAERARECREKHYAARRREPWQTTRVQLWRDGIAVET